MQRKEKTMKVLKESFSRLMVLGFGILGLIVALANCGNSPSSGGRVASFLNGLPGAHLSNDQNNSIIITALQQISPSSPLPFGWMAAYEITGEVSSADPLNNAPSYYVITDVIPTNISGGLQVNNDTYITDVTLSWINAQNQGYDYSALTSVTETANGALKENGNYSYLNGNAALSDNGNLDMQDQYGDGSQEQDNENYSASWNAQGFTPDSQSFSLNNALDFNDNMSIRCTPASTITDYTTGYKISTETGNGWYAYNYNITGTLNDLNYSENDGSASQMSGMIFSNTAANMTAQGGSGKVINLQEQFSGTTFTVNGNGVFGEINEESVAGQLVSPPLAPPDFSGKVSVSLRNLTFNNYFCGSIWYPWPMNGTITVRSADTYIYDFSVNNSGTNCGCALVTVNGVLTNNGQPVCGIDSASPVYLSLSGVHRVQFRPQFKTLVRQPLLKKIMLRIIK